MSVAGLAESVGVAGCSVRIPQRSRIGTCGVDEPGMGGPLPLDCFHGFDRERDALVDVFPREILGGVRR